MYSEVLYFITKKELVCCQGLERKQQKSYSSISNGWFILSPQESCRFTEQAIAILKAVGNVINNFSSKDELPKALKELEVAYCPPGLHGTKMAKENTKVNKQFLIDAYLKATDLHNC